MDGAKAGNCGRGEWRVEGGEWRVESGEWRGLCGPFRASGIGWWLAGWLPGGVPSLVRGMSET
jgi:hypothetical protein